MKEKSTTIKIPIYDMRFEFVVSDDIRKSQKKEPRFSRLGKQKVSDSMGVAIYAGWEFCIILDSRYIDHSLVAHEAFHVTHRILDYCNLEFKVNNHEAFAYMNGFLNEFMYKNLKKWKIRIK